MSLRLAILFLIVLAPQAFAQSKVSMPMLEQKSPWMGSVKYGLSSDFASDRSPRAYENILIGDVSYRMNRYWSAGVTASTRFITLDGQIPKDKEQDHTETLEPGASAELMYSRSFMQMHSYSFALHGEPLFAKDSRLEGHRGLVGVGGALSFGFFAKKYTMTHALDATSLINTYSTNSSGVANPDYFYTYKFINSLRFAQTYKISYTFGAKVTRYLDEFIGYSYSNSVSLSKAWENFAMSLSYDNGGFTDEGYISLWYIDDNRRVMRLMMSYAF